MLLDLRLTTKCERNIYICIYFRSIYVRTPLYINSLTKIRSCSALSSIEWQRKKGGISCIFTVVESTVLFRPFFHVSDRLWLSEWPWIMGSICEFRPGVQSTEKFNWNSKNGEVFCSNFYQNPHSNFSIWGKIDETL
jgi:hypothetical protein